MESIKEPLLENGGHQGASPLHAFSNMICESVGAGMLGLPFAVLFAKDFFAFPVVIGGLMCFYTAFLLHRTQLHHGAAGYQELGMLCFGAQTKKLVMCVLSTNQFGIVVLYIITICKNVELVSTSHDAASTLYCHVIIAILMFLFVTLGKGVESIGWVSSVGFISVLIVGVIVIVSAYGHDAETPNPASCPSVDWKHAFTGLGTAIFAYGGHAVYPDVQASMATPQAYAAVLKVAFASMTVFFTLVVGASRSAYGCAVQGYIIASLPSWSFWWYAAIFGFTLHLLAAIPIVMLPASRVVESIVPSRFNYYHVRMGLVVILVSFAYFFPYFAQVLSLLGGLTENILVLWFPIMFDYATFRPTCNCVGFLKLLLNLAIILLGLLVLVIGSYTSICDMIQLAGNHH